MHRSFLCSTVALALLPFICYTPMKGQDLRTFEMRYFTRDARADGVTDFHGETEILDTEGRVAVLSDYAAFASRFWGDPGLDTPLFTEQQIRDRLALIKPQPASEVRRTIPLENWKTYGYKPGKEALVAGRHKAWTDAGARISGGRLMIDGPLRVPLADTLGWRFRLKGTLASSALTISLGGLGGKALDIPVKGPGQFEVYGDLENGAIFLSSEGKTIREYSLQGDFTGGISAITLNGNADLEDLSLYNFIRQEDNPRTPYRSEMVFDEDFEEVPAMDGWQKFSYDDGAWQEETLPASHGGSSQAGEGYYLRKKIDVGSFGKALLDVEALDPGGEIWVNGEPTAVLKGRYPHRVDVSEYLLPGQENIIAVKVKPYYSQHPMMHAPSDRNIGWFLGRTSLVLTPAASPILEALVHTASLDEGKAVQHHRITVHGNDVVYNKGTLEIKYFPWFPEEGPCVASASLEVEIRPAVDNVFEADLDLESPLLWSADNPRLYRVQVVLKDKDGLPVDDVMTTTGVRKIEQRHGELFINNRPEMLNGAQIFGFRGPVETMARTVHCATSDMVMRELMMAKALGNMLRIHVHAERDIPEGINDPRYSEYADQMGLYLLWQTAGWIREGDASNVDIAHYPIFMKQVYNHPSIVLWEASNHPNRFKEHDFSDTEDYFNAVIDAITSTDSTRLVSPTSFWQHSWYANYDGTLDYKGGSHPVNPRLMHPMMTRGSQDAYTGYGRDWSKLRNYPSPWAKSCLDAKDLCYFNFEHEESAAQPNWTLARKEPWYEVPSYEQPYEKGSIGRVLGTDEWRQSQAFQALSAWESMKVQTLSGVSGYSWCSLESGPNMFTYQKPLVDPFYVPKLAFHANRMAFQRIWAASEEVDTVYGPGDEVHPVIFNLGGPCRVNLTIELQKASGKVVERRTVRYIEVGEGRSITRLSPFRFKTKAEGCYFVVYKLTFTS